MPRPLQLPSATLNVPPPSDAIDPTLPSGPEARDQAFIEERLAIGAPQARGGVSTSDTSAGSSSTFASEHLRRLSEYHERLRQQQTAPVEPVADAIPRSALPAAGTSQPQLPGLASNRWTSVGPMAVQAHPYDQTIAYSGRVAGVAVAPGGKRVYIATANGGVWRSVDEGVSWQSLMDAFNINPIAIQADSQACGAIALVAGEWPSQDTIYVGSGEAHGSGDAYYGVGPIVSIDGGLNWQTETSDPSLLGKAFFALAVDPIQPDRVVGATTNGLYLREPDTTATTGHSWRRTKEGNFSSVVAAHGDGQTIFYAAQQYGSTYQSVDGETWAPLGQAFPTQLVGRIALAVQPYNPNIVYALVATSGARFFPDGSLHAQMNHLHGVYRLDVNEGKWHEVAGMPETLFGRDLMRRGQGWYDMAIAIAPDEVNRIYLGGAAVLSDGIVVKNWGDWTASLYRCDISENKGSRNYEAETTFIGGPVHADVHAIAFAPGDPNQLYIGCDGGIFYSDKPTADPTLLDDPNHVGIFVPRNAGLSTMTMNYLGFHWSEEALLFCGTQDNGGLRFAGAELWQLSAGGDCGYCIINTRDPYHILTTYTRGSINRSIDGGNSTFYSVVSVPLTSDEASYHTRFYAPLAGAPYDGNDPTSANLIAFGSNRVWISEHFGGYHWWDDGSPVQWQTDWRSIPTGEWATDQLPARIRSLTFASTKKLYAGTEAGTVHRFDQNDEGWRQSDLPGIPGMMWSAITCIAVDPSDASGNSIYVTLGSYSNHGRVYYFDGTQWHPRSGPQDNPTAALMNVQHNAIAAAQENPQHLFVGADIGIWHSADAGNTWHPFSRGLPDAAVLDLQQHPVSGALYAATHGRGVYEFALNQVQPDVELYIRDHQLDLGRTRTTPLEESNHPLDKERPILAEDSPDIRFDLLNENGHYHLAQPMLDFFRFANELPDIPAPATLYTHDEAILTNRVYVQVHSHGAGLARHVRVILLLGKVTTALPALPAGYDERLRRGVPIENESWVTVGFRDLYNVRAEQPQVAYFALDSDLLPASRNLAQNDTFILVAIAHSFDDPFVANSNTIDGATERKLGAKRVTLLPFTGTVPEPIRPRPEEDDDILAEHQVVAGDSLSLLAKHYYGDWNLWPHIYRANKDVIGDNPNAIEVGMVLRIPMLSE